MHRFEAGATGDREDLGRREDGRLATGKQARVVKAGQFLPSEGCVVSLAAQGPGNDHVDTLC